MYKIAIQFSNNEKEFHNRVVKSMPIVGDLIRMSRDDSSVTSSFFFKTVRVIGIQHTAFVERYLDSYHKLEPDAIIIVRDYETIHDHIGFETIG